MLRGVGTAALLVLALAGCTSGPMPTPGPTKPSPSGDGVLRIGTLFSTGRPAAAGLTAAVNAAVREIDAAGGVNGAPVEVLSRNGESAADSFADLVSRGVDVVIGPSDMEVAAVLIPLAADAGIPLITPAASGERPDGVLLRTVPSDQAQGAVIAAATGAPKIALLRTAEHPGLATGIGDALVADIVITDDPVADAQQVSEANPDAVVLAAADSGPQTRALLSALAASGHGGAALWITGPALASYEIPLDGSHGIQTGAAPDAAFAAQVRQEDPGARLLLGSADAFDATVLVALAATLAGDDGGPSIEASLRAGGEGGIPCRSYGECLDVLATQPAIAYQGVSGPLVFDDAGDRRQADYTLYQYGADGAPAEAGKVTG